MIEVKNLKKRYGNFEALKGISFSVEKGEIVGFLGPNGAGKTTTMQIITGFISPSAGEVVIDGKKVDGFDIKFKKKIGYLPENNPIYNDLSVYDYLSFFANLKNLKNKKDEIRRVINLTKIEDVINKKIDTLSKGYKQRVGLAQAILGNPEILILDEPTTGLDPNQIIEIRNLIKELGKKKTVILSTHIMQEVEQTCERVIIINKGNIVADDRLDNLKGKNERIIIEVDKNLPETFFEKFGEVTRLSETKFLIKSNEDVRKEISKLCFENGVMIYELKTEFDDLETTFRKLTSVEV
ncbi:ABC transporter, ATP-binding protein [Deferribacter desulfuricans SSM1]|uniref:ABC transporter, ATP-binding protein n=1 Tax=Deferribacter desulfuricans (strain DSM 14783 / JCM 11476 / NBRC 101012 / SSM1) TaxID=639282 RepID=D3PEH7_DEFDS|nr:ATP-binding cassette domain-containing protein [Deferribacter desulfuricans]BAI81000.1 ABC transporter, ATP-binding protein [Deferribacter desulfuricans SSM1]